MGKIWIIRDFGEGGYSNLSVSWSLDDADVSPVLAGSIESVAQGISLRKHSVFPGESQGVWRGGHLPASTEILGKK